MAYNATYSESDTTAVIFDVGLKILVGVGTLATVFGLVIAVNMIRGKGFKLGKK